MKHTKEQLEGMSDFELSATILSGMNSNSVTFPTTTNESQAGTDVKSGFGGGFGSYYFDINNPSDMMHLVFESGISLSSPTLCGTDADAGEWQASAFYPQLNKLDIHVYHSNPLRAAAIVWLLMQG